MAKRNVADADYLMRFVPYKQQFRDAETDAFKGILNTAFALRPDDKGKLSLTWVEYYGEKCLSTYGVAATAFRDSFAKVEPKKLPTKAYFAIGQAGQTRDVAARCGKTIRIVHAPDGPNKGHVELHRFTDEDRLLLDALAVDVYTEHVAVTSIAFG